MYLKRDFLISVFFVVLAGFSFGKEIYFLGSNYTIDNLHPDKYHDVGSQTALMSSIGVSIDNFKGDTFGFLGSMSGGFGSSANFNGNSYPKNVLTNAYHLDVLLGAGYYKELNKWYFLFGGGVGLVSAMLDFPNVLDLPSFLNYGVGPGIYGGVGYSLTNRISIFFNTKAIYTLIGMLSSADIPFKPSFMVAPALCFGLAVN